MRGRISAALLAAVLVLAGATAAWAAFVQEGSPYPTGDDPLTVAAADFNGDGRGDVAAMNGTSSDVSVYLRRPGGGFAQEGAAISVGPNSGPSGGAVADYDGNGLPDLAVANFVAGNIVMLLRQPGGGFAQGLGSPIALGTRLSAIAVGQFGGDANLDLAVVRQDQAGVTILLRNGGSFSPQLQFSTGATPAGLATGDFNGDGVADLATANRGGASVTVAYGPAYNAPQTIPAGSDPVNIVAADFNGDGRSDLALTNFGPGTVTVLLRNAANDGFDAEPAIAVSTSPAGLTATDVDRDGRPDLAVATYTAAVEILHRNAGGGFTRDQPIALAGSPSGIAASDFDGDSRPDLAVTNLNDTWSALLNPAPAGPPPGPTPTATPTPLPTPVAGKTVNVAPVSGKVTIRRPGTKRFVTVTADTQIPVGSTIDTRKGRIEITADQGKGKTASATFFDGLFKLTQSRGAKPVTTLTLTEKLSCPKARGAAVAAKKKKSRKLWGDGSGSFRTRGQYSSATIRGTKWLTKDSCTSTLTQVAKGVVTVNDLVKHRTVIVRAGKRYTARARRR